jgi:hypothetical protein
MTGERFDRDEAGRASQRNDADARENPPRAIGSRTRFPDESEGGLATPEKSDDAARTTTADESAPPAFARQYALAVEQKAVRIRRQRLASASSPASSLGEERKEKSFVAAPTIAATVKTLLRRLVPRRTSAPATPSPGETSGPPKDSAGEVDAIEQRTREMRETQHLRSSLAGLALSGGGIRSATFALGFLQAMGERRLLWIFDYLSTVSGGGYVGGWWSAWLSRPDYESRYGLFPPDERLEPDRFPAVLLKANNTSASIVAKDLPAGTPEGSRSAWLRDPIHHLRLFSNYLTPKKGALSADTWRAITIISRNLVLTWLILLPLLFAVVVAGQLYFVSNPEVGYHFVCSRPDSISVDTTMGSSDDIRANAIRTIRITHHIRSDASDGCKRAFAADSVRFLADSVRAGKAPRSTLAILHGEVLRHRVRVLADPLFAGLLLMSAFTILWMIYGTGAIPLTMVGLLGVAAAVRFLLPSGNVSGDGTWIHFRNSIWFKASGGAWIVVMIIGLVLPRLAVAWRNAREELIRNPALSASEKAQIPRDRVRNIIVQWHSRVLILFVVTMAALLAAGFAHELTWFLFDPQSGAIAGVARKAGGWAAVAFSVGSGLYTILKAGPTAKGKDAAVAPPSLPATVMLSIGPVIVLAALVVAAATLTRWIFSAVSGSTSDGDLLSSGGARLTTAALIGIGLLLFFALYERCESGSRAVNGDSVWRRLHIVGVPVLTVLAFLASVRWLGIGNSKWDSTPVYVALGCIGLIGMVRLSTTWLEDGAWSLTSRSFASLSERQTDDTVAKETEKQFGLSSAKARQARAQQRAHRLQALLKVVAMAFTAELVAWCWLSAQGFFPHELKVGLLGGSAVSTLAIAGVLLALVFLLLDFLFTRRDSDRSVALMLGAALTSGALVILYNNESATSALEFTTVGVALIALLVSLVTGLGWMADPNLLALHNFYKARLVRAYLGASNATERRDKEITETAPHDDLALKDLKNHERGAPVHIINATLNLVGGRDLATAQRSAAPFTMSSEICGSARTGYHPTSEYMRGTLSLGTAIATSGAAVSTNMGSKTISSSLALLLALFNIRLGLWAPTPNKGRWYESRPRLWPFYLLQEALSQTNDVGAYCYLTDGGHFDNTGLYALIERGCRRILVLDDGADPLPCFSDMGEAIRRCRIDFGAEIGLSKALDQFIPDSHGLGRVHVTRGRIEYSTAHLEMLGWSDENIQTKRNGIILWVKPVLTKEDAVDVRQYKLENRAFPHQTTADQWYDESQFESYRALGYQAIARAIDRVLPGEKPGDFEDIDAFFTALCVGE